MKDFWNNRYAEPQFAYGQKPNEFFKQQLDNLTHKGTLLLPGEGEGRNAVYAAMKGWDVVAVDYSEAARNKAVNWAKELGVEFEYAIKDLSTLELPEGLFDAAGLIYLHLEPELRKQVHKEIQKALRPGGKLIIEAFHPDQLALGYNSGGPKNEKMLYTLHMLQKDFDQCIALEASQEVLKLDEGNYHQGQAAVVRMLLEKE